MKHLCLLIALLLVSCAQETTITAPPPSGRFTVTEFAPDGSTIAVHETRSYVESGFPPSITFRDKAGVTRKVRGSYLVQER